MAKQRALKVYRTAIGFHDAYVAAPSQKAALEAWGSDKDLFGRGAAELVTDKKLAEAALAQPGVVIRRPRGTTAEYLAALPKMPDKPMSSKVTETELTKPKRRPSRTKLSAAEQRLEEGERNRDAKLAALDVQIRKLNDERARQRAALDSGIRVLEERRDKARNTYNAAIENWRN